MFFSTWFDFSTSGDCCQERKIEKFPFIQFIRHFATLHSGFYWGKRIKAGMERSEMTSLWELVDGLDCVPGLPDFFKKSLAFPIPFMVYNTYCLLFNFHFPTVYQHPNDRH